MSKGNRTKNSLKPMSGGAKLKAAGRHPILLAVNAAQLATLREAAGYELRPVTQFVVFHALDAAYSRIIDEARERTAARHQIGDASSSTKTVRSGVSPAKLKSRAVIVRRRDRSGKAATHE